VNEEQTATGKLGIYSTSGFRSDGLTAVVAISIRSVSIWFIQDI
jgi:hypothetical protein